MNEWDGDAADAPRDATHCNDGNVTTRRDWNFDANFRLEVFLIGQNVDKIVQMSN